MTIRVCLVGDDAHPPWNHASSILTKRMLECLSQEGLECSLATSAGERNWSGELASVRKMFARTSGRPSLDAVRLSIAGRAGKPDVFHLVGTNALVFSPFSKLIWKQAKIIRHIFTPYDARDRAVGPVRSVANRLFIDSYAFTTPRIGQWEEEVPEEGKRFLVRPPVDTSFYKPNDESGRGSAEKDRAVVVYMGPLMPTRFPKAVVLEAMRGLKDEGVRMRLVVLTSASRTSTDDCEELLEMSRKLGLSDDVKVDRVDLSEKERIAWYNAADVVVFPYVGPEPEKLADPPFGILEAMSCGRIVLATDVLSVSDVVKDGLNGFLIPHMTAESFGSGLRRALETTGSMKVGERARDSIVEAFDYPIVARQAIEAYTRLVG